MKNLYYNPVRDGRMKNLVIGMLTIFISVTFLFWMSRNQVDRSEVDKSQAFLIFAPAIVLVVLLYFIPFGQILESSNGELSLYYRLGSIKFNKKNLGSPKAILLEQNEFKYYCIRIQFVSGNVSEMEKHPTLDWARIRFKEYETLID